MTWFCTQNDEDVSSKHLACLNLAFFNFTILRSELYSKLHFYITSLRRENEKMKKKNAKK